MAAIIGGHFVSQHFHHSHPIPRGTLTRMQRFSLIAASALALALVSGTTLHAQKTTPLAAGGGGSAHARTEWTVAGANISITYGRPALKGRPEATMMPLKKPWRTGADEATVLKTDKALKFGTVTLQPGSYTINTEPGESAWTLLLGKLATPDQWGIEYQPKLEIGRAPMTLTKAATPVELVTFAIDPTKDGGTLHVEWGTRNAAVPFVVVR